MVGGLTVNAAAGGSARPRAAHRRRGLPALTSSGRAGGVRRPGKVAFWQWHLREFRDASGFDPSFRHAEDRDLCRPLAAGRRAHRVCNGRESPSRPPDERAEFSGGDVSSATAAGAGAIQPPASGTRPGTMIVGSARFAPTFAIGSGIHSPKSHLRHVPSVAALLGDVAGCRPRRIHLRGVRRSQGRAQR